MLNRRTNWYFALNKNNGFTLVELIVTMAVLLIITSMALAKYPNFNQSVALKKTSQEIALVIRQAQAYGLGVREYVPGSGKYPGYGVYFDISNPASFILYADVNTEGNKLYDGEFEVVESFEIKSGDRIFDLCGMGAAYVCGLNTLDMVYFRPSPVVDIKANGSVDLSNAEIKLKSPNGETKKITIWKSGQISVE